MIIKKWCASITISHSVMHCSRLLYYQNVKYKMGLKPFSEWC